MFSLWTQGYRAQKNYVIPADAGIQAKVNSDLSSSVKKFKMIDENYKNTFTKTKIKIGSRWIPAFAGMTVV